MLNITKHKAEVNGDVMVFVHKFKYGNIKI